MDRLMDSSQEYSLLEAQGRPVYMPRILRSMREICDATGVGEKTVRAWVGRGAPIAVEGQGTRTRYSAELAALQFWRWRPSSSSRKGDSWEDWPDES